MNDSEKPIQPLWFRYLVALSILMRAFGLAIAVTALVGSIVIVAMQLQDGGFMILGILAATALFLLVVFCFWWPLDRWLRDRRAQYRD